MRILVVGATRLEMAPLARALHVELDASARLAPARAGTHDVDLLITGVGMVATAAWCARTLAETRYDLALQFGFCGSFDRARPLGDVVHVVTDQLAELGVEDGDAFRTLAEIGLVDADEFPLTGGVLRNAAPPRIAAIGALPAVSGITVNTVHGDEASIARVVARCRPDVESMEGAAFMFACLIAGLPFAQVRAVSNFVERRNRAAWTIDEALDRLTRTAARILEQA